MKSMTAVKNAQELSDEMSGNDLSDGTIALHKDVDYSTAASKQLRPADTQLALKSWCFPHAWQGDRVCDASGPLSRRKGLGGRWRLRFWWRIGRLMLRQVARMFSGF